MKVNQRLTANIGLRWDIMVPFTENNNNIVYINFQNPTVLDPAAGNLPGGASKYGNCTGCAGITRADIHWKNLQPRVGVSYKLNSKTVIQAGFFMTYLDGGAYEYGTTADCILLCLPIGRRIQPPVKRQQYTGLRQLGCETRCPCRRQLRLAHRSGTETPFLASTQRLLAGRPTIQRGILAFRGNFPGTCS